MAAAAPRMVLVCEIAAYVKRHKETVLGYIRSQGMTIGMARTPRSGKPAMAVTEADAKAIIAAFSQEPEIIHPEDIA